jgi:hypothetical protein
VAVGSEIAVEVRGDGGGGWWRAEVMVAAMEENPKFMIFQIFEAAEVGSSERFSIFRIKRDNGLRTRSRLAKVGGRDGSGLKKDPKCLYFKSGGEKRKEEGVRKEKMEGEIGTKGRGWRGRSRR